MTKNFSDFIEEDVGTLSQSENIGKTKIKQYVDLSVLWDTSTLCNCDCLHTVCTIIIIIIIKQLMFQYKQRKSTSPTPSFGDN